MKRICKLGISFVFAVFCIGALLPSPASARSEAGVISGELVVIEGSRSQFRIVDHAGTYTAPAGVSLEALDGKTVQVEIANGRVLQIIETPVPINPIDHGFESVSGELVVRDAVSGTFTIAGDGRIFTAPVGTDVRAYAGRRVALRLDEQGRLVEIQPGGSVVVPPSSRIDVVPSTSLCSFDGQGYSEGVSLCRTGTQYRCEAGAWRTMGTCATYGNFACIAGGATYAEGATRCEDGMQFRCDHGQWLSLGVACAAIDVSDVRPAPRTCIVGGATVADGSSICRAGTTYRCTYGQWVNVGSSCS